MPEVLVKVSDEIKIAFQFFDFFRDVHAVSIVNTYVVNDIGEGPNVIKDQPRKFLK